MTSTICARRMALCICTSNNKGMSASKGSTRYQKYVAKRAGLHMALQALRTESSIQHYSSVSMSASWSSLVKSMLSSGRVPTFPGP